MLFEDRWPPKVYHSLAIIIGALIKARATYRSWVSLVTFFAFTGIEVARYREDCFRYYNRISSIISIKVYFKYACINQTRTYCIVKEGRIFEINPIDPLTQLYDVIVNS